MATARVRQDVLYTIDINTLGQSDSPGLVIQQTDTITFNNLAPFAVKIQFIAANGPVFNDIANIPAGSAQGSSQGPQKGAITVNYTITNLQNQSTHGPYGIQVTVGAPNNPAPLLIPISASNAPANQKTTSIPLSGWVEFNLDQGYNLSWNPSTAFPAPANPVGPGTAGPYQAKTGNQAKDATWTLASTLGVTGNGTVHIRS